MYVCRRKSEILFQVFATCCNRFAFDILLFCADCVNSCGNDGKMWMHYRTFDIKSYIIIRLLVHPVEEQQHQDSGYCGRKNVPMSRHLYWILGELLRPPLLYQCQERCPYALYLADKVRMFKTASVACRAPCFYCIYACTYGQRFSF